MVEAPPRDQSSPEYSHQEESVFDYREWFVGPNTPARGQLSFKSVTLYAFDAADVIDDGNYNTVLESFVSTLSL